MAERAARRPHRRLAAALLAAACGACGGADEGGHGNGVLLVACEVLYTPVEDPRRAAGADVSVATARVTRGGAAVPGAAVTLVDLDGQESFTLAGRDGDYAGRWPGYRRRLALEARDGDDFVSCALTGPGRHLITQPTAGALHSRDVHLPVAWQKDPADRGASLEAARTDCAVGSGYLATTERGHSRLEVPGSQLAVGAEAVAVTRHREMTPTGAATGSTFRISYGVSVPFVVR